MNELLLMLYDIGVEEGLPNKPPEPTDHTTLIIIVVAICVLIINTLFTLWLVNRKKSKDQT